MQRTTMDLWVGLFVVTGIVALMILSLKVGNLNVYNPSQSYTITGTFENIGGLKVRAPVKSAGVVVGRVTAIRLNEKTYQAEVTLALDRRYQFPKDSSAKIMTSGLLGEQYIGLEPGGDAEMIKPGERFTLTQSAVVLENLIGQFLYGKAAEGGAK